MDRAMRDRAAGWPPFTDDPIDRLRHVLAVFESHVHPDDWAIRATSNALPGFPETGITWGDLAEIARILERPHR